MFIKKEEEEEEEVVKPNPSTMMQGKWHMVLDQKNNRKSERKRSGLLVKQRAKVFSYGPRPCPHTIHCFKPVTVTVDGHAVLYSPNASKPRETTIRTNMARSGRVCGHGLQNLTL